MIATGLVVAFALAYANDADHKYRLRGDAQNKRYEGTTKEPVSGGPGLISLLSHRLDLSGKPLPKKLRVRFYLPDKGTAFVTAREIEMRESYRMKVVRKDWEAGWAEFSEWPTAEVVVPLKIDLANLGVLVRKNSREGSGTVYPAIFCADSWPERVERYSATVKSKYSRRNAGRVDAAASAHSLDKRCHVDRQSLYGCRGHAGRHHLRGCERHLHREPGPRGGGRTER